MMNLTINFYQNNISNELRTEFNSAVQWEECDMSITMNNEQIMKLENKIQNTDKYSAQEIQAFQAKRDELVEAVGVLECMKQDLEEDHKKVVTDMTRKNSDHFGNSMDNVRTVLRVLASWNNSKLVKYAIIPAFQSPDLYNALETIHVNSKAGEDGQLVMSKEVKEAYKVATNELNSIIKNTFSLPFETSYTAKTRVKMTAEDRKLLNDCYIRGFRNKFSVDDETGKVSFQKRQINTLVKAKKDRKTGNMKYDYSGLATTIANIVLAHYFK